MWTLSGYPIHERGVSAFPGLYFIGLHWLHKAKSALLCGVGEDAEHVVAMIHKERLDGPTRLGRVDALLTPD